MFAPPVAEVDVVVEVEAEVKSDLICGRSGG